MQRGFCKKSLRPERATAACADRGIEGDDICQSLWHVVTRSMYPLVNVNQKLWKDPPFLMGKSTISTGPFSIANC